MSTSSTQPAPPEAGPSPRRFSLGAFDATLIAPLMLGAILNPVNSAILAVSLVPIGADFGAPASQTTWLVSALYLATSIGQPVAGSLIDSIGPRPVFLAGAALTGIAGILGTLAPSLAVLVAARVVLGFGTCAGYPAAMSLIRREADRTGQDSPSAVLTVLAVSSQTIAVIGPTLGGLLIGLAGWRATLAVNVPLAAACLVLGARRLPRTPSPAVAGHPRRALRLDYPGIAAFALALVAILLFFTTPTLTRLWFVAVGAGAGVAFAIRELRCPAPFIDLRVLGGNVPLLLSYARALMTSIVSYGFLYGFTQWLEDGRGLSATHAGLVLLPMFALAIAVSTLTGRRQEVRAKLLVGQGVQVLVCAALLLLSSGSAVWTLLIVTATLGVPQGLNNLAVQNAVYHQADPSRIGASAGLLRTFLYLGAIVSSALGGVTFGPTAGTSGLHHLAVVMVVVSLAGLTITLLDPSLAAVGRTRARPGGAPGARPDGSGAQNSAPGTGGRPA